MSVIEFQGGPSDGQRGLYEDSPAPQTSPDAAAPPSPAGDEDEQGILTSLLEGARQVLSMGTLSEANKLLIEQATTLIQKVKASEEKEMDDAMSGKLSPGILRKASGGGAGY